MQDYQVVVCLCLWCIKIKMRKHLHDLFYLSDAAEIRSVFLIQMKEIVWFSSQYVNTKKKQPTENCFLWNRSKGLSRV